MCFYFTFSPITILVCNGIGQVISFIWTAGTGFAERVPQSKELFTRFSKWGKMTEVESKHVNQPVFALDNCCTDTQWLKDGGFTNPEVVGDVYHITKNFEYSIF